MAFFMFTTLKQKVQFFFNTVLDFMHRAVSFGRGKKSYGYRIVVIIFLKTRANITGIGSWKASLLFP